MKNIKEKVIEKIEPTLDKYFPKGEKFSRRGEALALFSLTLIETLAEVCKVLKEIPYDVILRLEKGNYIEDGEVDGCKEKVLMYIIEEELKQKLGIKEKKLR